MVRTKTDYSMELFESHFSNLRGNLYEDDDGSYSLFTGKGRSRHINYLTFKALFENMKSPKNLVILESGITSRGQLYVDMVDFYTNTGIMPGKGMYMLDQVNNAEKIIHNYQLLYRFLEKPV